MPLEITTQEWEQYWRLLNRSGTIIVPPDVQTLTFEPYAVQVGHLMQPEVITYAAVVNGVPWCIFGREGHQGKTIGPPGRLTGLIQTALSKGIVVRMTVEFILMLPNPALRGVPRVAQIGGVLSAVRP